MPPPRPVSLPAHLLPALHTSDASLYPSPLPLSLLQSWHAAAPRTTLFYAPNNGIVLALPLKLSYWRRVISGDLREWEITPDMFGDGGGLHIWHVERFGGWKKEWGRFADRVAEDLGLRERRWSALVVTEEGRGMFERLGGKVGGYKGQVVVGGRVLENEGWDGVGVVEGEAVMLVGGVE